MSALTIEMADTVNTNRENLRGDADESPKSNDTAASEKIAMPGRAAIDVSQFVEDVDSTSGEISESVKGQSEKNSGTGSSAKTAKGQNYDIEQIKARLLSNLPDEKEMRRQIEAEIRKEIKYLHKRTLKLLGEASSMSFFEMTNVMKKIRELRSVLLRLVKASFDGLKTLWLRYVHGIMQ